MAPIWEQSAANSSPSVQEGSEVLKPKSEEDEEEDDNFNLDDLGGSVAGDGATVHRA